MRASWLGRLENGTPYHQTQCMRHLKISALLVCRITHSRQNNHMFLTVNTELLTMLMTSLACDAVALGSIKVEVEIKILDQNLSLLKMI